MGSASTVLLSDIDPTRTEQSLAACRAELTSVEFETAWAAGQAMTTDEAVGFALRATRSDAAASAYDEGSRSVSHSRLTERETQVLRLIVEGNTNREIATTLVLSPRTVERHIANVYAKLGARNRAGVTAYAVRHGLASIG
jgi:DNA-binding NarL/FixJ family response regulator